MVDGSKIGSSIPFKLFGDEEFERKIKKHGENNRLGWTRYAKQNFRNADIIAIETIGEADIALVKEGEPLEKSDKTTYYTVHAICGNNVVTVYTPETSIAQHWNEIKDKIVLCTRKPYILNGDCHNIGN